MIKHSSFALPTFMSINGVIQSRFAVQDIAWHPIKKGKVSSCLICCKNKAKHNKALGYATMHLILCPK